MTTIIIKSSSSKKIALPATLINSFGFEEDQQVEVKKWGTGLIIKPIDLSHNEKSINNSAEMARKEFRDKSTKKFKTAKGAIDYLHSL